jgi:hypothetical protein
VEPKDPFSYHKPSAAGVEKIEEIRAGCRQLNQLLLTLPNSRERSLAITNLEQVSMWANKAVVMHDPEAVPDT